MRAPLLLLAFGALAIATYACGSFGGDGPVVDSEDGSGGGPDSAAAEAAGPGDAAVDAAVDAPVEDALPGTFCATQTALFCEDFDQGDVTVRGWSADPDNTDAPTIGTKPHRSSPNALRSKTPAAAGVEKRSRLQRTVNVSGATTKWSYEAEIFLAPRDVPATEPAIIFGFTLIAAPPIAIVLSLGADGKAGCSGFSIASVTPLDLPVGEWTKVVVSVEDLDSLGYQVVCTVGVQSTMLSAPKPDAGVVSLDRKLVVGAVNSAGNGGFEALYDNVVFRAE